MHLDFLWVTQLLVQLLPRVPYVPVDFNRNVKNCENFIAPHWLLGWRCISEVCPRSCYLWVLIDSSSSLYFGTRPRIHTDPQKYTQIALHHRIQQSKSPSYYAYSNKHFFSEIFGYSPAYNQQPIPTPASRNPHSKHLTIYYISRITH